MINAKRLAGVHVANFRGNFRKPEPAGTPKLPMEFPEICARANARYVLGRASRDYARISFARTSTTFKYYRRKCILEDPKSAPPLKLTPPSGRWGR